MKQRFGIQQRLLIIAVFGIVVAGVAWQISKPAPLTEALRKNSSSHPPEYLLKLARQRLKEAPDDWPTVILAARLCRQLNDARGELSFLERLPIDGTDDNASRHRRRAELYVLQGEPSSAIRILLEVLAVRADDDMTVSRLARIRAQFGFRVEAVRLLRELLSRGHVTRQDLISLALNEGQLESPSMLERLARKAGSVPDPVLAHALVVLARMRRDVPEVIRLLAAQSGSDDLSRMSVRLAFETGKKDVTHFEALSRLLSMKTPHPDTWRLCADAALNSGSNETALIAVQSSLRADPWNQESLAVLEGLMRSSSPAEAEKLLAIRSELKRIHILARRVRDRSDSEDIVSLAMSMARLGRFQEALEWARLAPRSRSARQLVRARGRIPQSEQLPDFVTQNVSRTKEVLEWLNARIKDKKVSRIGLTQPELRDVAADVDLAFRYENGVRAEQEGLFMHQWTGGGVAELDLDNDLWPDLFFSQGGDLEKPDAQSKDGMFRNVQGTRFEAVADLAMNYEGGFGQGVAAGDIDNDGFTDLLVARAGENVLLLNQGDGTFLQSELYPAEDSWTTSVAVADIDGDANPDIYEVNYLTGDSVYTQRCDHDGRQRICAPTDFPPAPDRILLADGRGGFMPYDRSANGAERGMGVMIAELDGDPGVEIYIANDEGPNQLLSLQDMELVDEGVTTGLAYGRDGRSLGSMGIAIGTPMKDGRPVLFVTNYYSEPNNFYRSVMPGSFVDQTSAVRLLQPGYTMLGFGCCFRDLNADGEDDLIVANGHLDDFTHYNHPFQMPTQICLNGGDGQFRLAAANDGYLSRHHLGRSVVTTDWNGDGAPDVVVTHLDSPVALLENQLSFDELSVQVVGTNSARDAVGTVIVSRDIQRYVTAGDGYQSSGGRWQPLPTDSGTLRFRLPGQHEQQVKSPGRGGAYRFIEHSRELFRLPL